MRRGTLRFDFSGDRDVILSHNEMSMNTVIEAESSLREYAVDMDESDPEQDSESDTELGQAEKE